jgi:Protein of unknown function DUF262
VEVGVRIENDGPEEAFYDEETTYQINTFGADFTVDGLVNRFERDNIFRPGFQRNFVWTLRQSSRFIESILLGLPIPSVFLYREEDSGRHLIVDGLQRLSTLHGFAQNRFPNTTRSFRLSGVQHRFENKTITELDLPDHRRFYDAVIHSIIIQQLAPDNDRTSVFHIFERLNSYGTPLHPQEMRAAIFHGAFQGLLLELNQTPSWRLVFGPEHRRSKDQELILRFLALNELWIEYEKPMAKFLNHFMARYRQVDTRIYRKFAIQWTSVIDRIFDALGPRAFKPRGALNVALFDAITVAVASVPKLGSGPVKSLA